MRKKKRKKRVEIIKRERKGRGVDEMREVKRRKKEVK